MFSEFGRGVAPRNRFGVPIALSQVTQHLRFEFLAILEVPRGEDVSLESGEDQLHLIQPRGVDGQPMDVDSEREVKAPNPRLDLLGRMGRSVVQDEMEHRDPLTPEAAEEHVAEPLEVHEPLALKTPRQGLALMDQQRGEEIESALPCVAGADPQGLAGTGRQDATGHLQRLDAGLLIRTDDDCAVLDERMGLLVEPQHGGGLLQEAGIGGLLPGAVLPGLDAVLA